MKLRFSLNYRIVLLVAVLLPVLLTLGNWQLRREAEKREIQNAFQSRLQQAPVAFSKLDQNTDLSFMPVRLKGEFDSEAVYLLDNRIHQGQVGYEVLVPFAIKDEGSESAQWLLLNRGWIKAPPRRSDLPLIPELPSGSLDLVGEVYVPPGEGYQLAQADSERSAWPQLITVVDMDRLGQSLGRQLFQYQIRLKADQPGALVTDWPPINVSPEKHRAYAVQWFAMALGLMVWLVVASTSVAKRTQSDT